jgi:hypothetical protein
MRLLLPLRLVDAVFRLPWILRPQFLTRCVQDTPSSNELLPGMLFCEVRGGHMKWAHLHCPLCDDHIQLPLAGKERWLLKVDALRRPTLSPSIWEIQGCGAHFFIQKGQILWCKDN